MKPTVIFDTSIGSENLGDKIIMDYALKILEELLPDKYFVHLTTHDYLGRRSKGIYKRSEYKILCGTNILSANMGKRKKKQWWLDLLDYHFLRDVILLSVGWRQYEGEMDGYTKSLLKKVLSHNHLLSVRDSYTEERLKSIGFTNVLNTSCHTAWGLTPEFCKTIPETKAKNVVTTITDYRKNPEADKFMLETLCENYDNVYLWLQSYFDQKYIESFFDMSKVHIVPPTLKAFDEVLKMDDLDYVGTRLHAGIRALNNHKRSLIVGVDNRAIEIAKDIKINVILRENFEKDLKNMINGKLSNKIVLPQENIEKWKAQFKNK